MSCSGDFRVYEWGGGGGDTHTHLAAFATAASKGVQGHAVCKMQSEAIFDLKYM